MSTISLLLSILVAAAGCFLALCALYLLVLAISSSFAPTFDPTLNPRSRLAVLVPAHNEAQLVQRCVHSLGRQTYPPDRYEVIVIADNCTDDTARLAVAAGAQVLARTEPNARGKGRALRWAMDRILNDGTEQGSPLPDAFVIVDADSVAEEGLLTRLAHQFEQGAEAVQGEYRILDDDSSSRVRLREVAFLLFHRVRFSGRAALHLPCHLVGNGILLSRPLVERYPWNAFTAAEDLEYSVNLRLQRVRPVFCPDALVRGPVPASRAAAQVQRERWEGGRLHVLRCNLPILLREIIIRSRLSLLDVAVDLLVPPLGILVIGAMIGSALSIGLAFAKLTPYWLLAPWTASFVGSIGFVIVGLRASGAPMSMYRALLSAPVFLLQKLVGTVGVLRSKPEATWIRTERPSEVG